MFVFQISFELYLTQDIDEKDALVILGKYLDSALCKNEEGKEFHTTNQYKYYCYNSLYPTERDKVYKCRKKYRWQVRTVNMEFAEFLSNQLVELDSRFFKVVDAQLKILPKKNIASLYSITPCIAKIDRVDESESPYWRDTMTVEDFQEKIKANLVKKYNQFTGASLDEDFQMFQRVEVVNRMAIGCNYKGKKLLGDKLDLFIEENDRAQELAYFALGAGILEMNSRGYGFVNDKWRKK